MLISRCCKSTVHQLGESYVCDKCHRASYVIDASIKNLDDVQRNECEEMLDNTLKLDEHN